MSFKVYRNESDPFVAMSALMGPTVTEVIGPTLGRFDD
jgi:hypothetical protein